MEGRLALIQRGSCNFSLKAYYAQQAGAVGFLIYAHFETQCEPPGYYFMAAGDSAHTVRIPGAYIPCGYFYPPCPSVSCGMVEALDAGQTVVAQLLPVVGVGTEPLPAVGRLTQVRPNPSSGTTTIVVRLDVPGRTRVQVVDPLGRLVAPLFDGMLEAGEVREFELAPGRLPAGTYMVRVTGEGFRETRQITLLR